VLLIGLKSAALVALVRATFITPGTASIVEC